MIPTTSYIKTFWNEFKINNDTQKYHIVFDQIITGAFDVKKLEEAIVSLVEKIYLLQCHLFSDVNDNIYWKPHNRSIQLQQFSSEEQENIEHLIRHSFDLSNVLLSLYIILLESSLFLIGIIFPIMASLL